MSEEEIFAATDRLVLRRLVVEDVPALVAYHSDPQVVKFQSWSEFGEDDARTFVESQRTVSPGTPGAWFQFAIGLRPSGELVGDIGLHVRADNPALVDVGYTLMPRHQRQGYATEAVRAAIQFSWDHVGVTSVRATIHQDNERSLAVARRLGMKEVHVIPCQWRGMPGVEHVFEARRERNG
jgi:RimJ/RimL family protein N-acetyltransferase